MTLRVTCPHCGQRNAVEEVKTQRVGDGLALDLGWCEHCQGALAEVPDSKLSVEAQVEARRLVRERARLVQEYNSLIRRGAMGDDLVGIALEIKALEERLTELGL